jgi:hypothetical protein
MPNEAEKDKRGDPRVKVGFPVSFSQGRKTGRGFVTDVSDGGALIEQASIAPKVGSVLTLQLRLGGVPTEVNARVVRSKSMSFRTRSKHFAVSFIKANARLQQLLRVALSRQAPGTST